MCGFSSSVYWFRKSIFFGYRLNCGTDFDVLFCCRPSHVPTRGMRCFRPIWSPVGRCLVLVLVLVLAIVRHDSGESLVHDIDFVSPVVLHEFSATVPIVETHVASVPVVQPFITATLDHPINVGPPDIGHIHTISDVGVTSVIEDHDMMSPDEITIIIDTWGEEEQLNLEHSYDHSLWCPKFLNNILVSVLSLYPCILLYPSNKRIAMKILVLICFYVS